MENKSECKSSFKLRLTDPVRRLFAIVTAPVALRILIIASAAQSRKRKRPESLPDSRGSEWPKQCPFRHSRRIKTSIVSQRIVCETIPIYKIKDFF